ncbi:flagellar protein FlaG [Nitrosomonas sp.]|uniref:flagellar protein FlaG n=1 Tax=Nitrosomonas sp. TaxID=42353 RepID=UPI001E0C5DF3|nr:flagellar protein FlaG [Nitrosomonas sp.]MCB1947402.1 flagellar protein FlaG [Nitrosomonas sp.]MCP5242936.1 flagellar protein FlaG [Burkholderiales bacterium]MDR4515293.1 flagellar protein FlaG [Nitrosomonas sp.]
MAINHINEATGNLSQPLLTLPPSQNVPAANSRTASSTQVSKIEQNIQSEIPIEQAAEKIKETVNNLAQNLQFSIDEDTGKTVIKVMDVQTQEIIRQIPSQEAISIARTLDKVQGLLLNDEA